MNDVRIILMGQAPGPNTSPDMPLFPHPSTSTGARLCKLLDMERAAYMRTFTRCNLLHKFPGRHKHDDKFPVAQARATASAMRPLLSGSNVIFIGRKVATAFGHSEVSFFEWGVDPIGQFRYAIIPHPSGRNKFYTLKENVEKCRSFLKSVKGLITEHEVD